MKKSRKEILTEIGQITEALRNTSNKDQIKVLEDTLDDLYEELKSLNNKSSNNRFGGYEQINS